MKHLFFLISLFISAYSISQSPTPYLEELVKEFPNVRDIAISPNGDEIMFSAQNINGSVSAIISVRKIGDKLDKAEIASFSGQYFDIEPFFSHDGLKLYYASKRPLDNTSNKEKDFDIWYVEREHLNSKWSKPQNIGAPVNTIHGEFYPSISKNGNLYFTRDNPELKRKDDIYFSSWQNNSYSEPKTLPDAINSKGYEYNAFIAPDESYLIYGCYNRKDGLGSGDLYISFKNSSGWTPAKNLGKTINSTKMDYCPFVDANNNLYFTSKREVNSNNSKNKLTIKTLKDLFNSYSNGASRLYKIPLDLKSF